MSRDAKVRCTDDAPVRGLAAGGRTTTFLPVYTYRPIIMIIYLYIVYFITASMGWISHVCAHHGISILDVAQYHGSV